MPRTIAKNPGPYQRFRHSWSQCQWQPPNLNPQILKCRFETQLQDLIPTNISGYSMQSCATGLLWCIHARTHGYSLWPSKKVKGSFYCIHLVRECEFLYYSKGNDIVLSCSSCRETTKILCGQLNARCTTWQVVHRALSCPQRIFVVSLLKRAREAD